ncbi:MAG: hypothetical protein L0Z50_32200 [Verrucomicrobiales bacterium]|nr:hypothetical protein [Verrucomicrobiales bacterium]
MHTTPREGGPDGYVSSDNCRSCHPDQYASWHESYHRTMTQLARPEGVVGDFKGVKLELLGKTYHLDRRGDEFWVEMEDPEWRPRADARSEAAPRVQRRLGLLTGSHHMQAYWFAGERGNMQTLFPFVWLIADRRWVPFHNTFLRDPSIAPANQTWNLNCINCHATAGQPRPNHRTKQFETRTGELGIACEACHGPAEEHVRHHRNPTERYLRYLSAKPDPTIVNPAKLPARQSGQVCGQCHGIKWIPNRDDHLENGFRYRPGQELSQTAPIVRPTQLEEQPWLTNPLKQNPTFLRDRYWSDGMVRVSGREYNGLVESACHQRGELSCISCHSMHQSQSSDDQLAKLMESNHACLQCHTGLADKLTQHTHHAAKSSGSLCYNCHMPHTTYGLLKAIRSHQIDSPTASATVQTGRPNACNLCHLDQTLAWTSRHLNNWYQQSAPLLNEEQSSISAAVLSLSKGDAGQRALIAWSMGWAPAQAVSGNDWLAPYLAHLLDDPYSAVRYIAVRSLKSLGSDYGGLAYDFIAPEAERAAAKVKVLELWNRAQAQRAVENRVSLLISNGQLQQTRLDGLLKERNNRSMDLQE